MKYILLTTIFSFCCSFANLSANNPQRHKKVSKKEFRDRQAAFIAEKAQLTQEESADFFPVYFELQDKKKKINERLVQAIRNNRNQETSEKEYDEMINLWLDVREDQTELETTYTKKFRQILSAEKLFKVMHAEMRFHRNMMKIMHRKMDNKH